MGEKQKIENLENMKSLINLNKNVVQTVTLKTNKDMERERDGSLENEKELSCQFLYWKNDKVSVKSILRM